MYKLFSHINILRYFTRKIIFNVEIIYNYNIKNIDLILNLNSLNKFWTFFIILNKSIFFNYNQLNDITCIDNLNLSNDLQDEEKNRFTLIYILTNIKYKSRLIIRIPINKNQRVPSLTNVFLGANWLEREIFDLFGIVFSNHSDLRRIMTDYGFTNHPLLKDFPLTVI